MVKIALPLATAAAGLLLTAAVVSASPARAMSESLSCQTVNDQTVCVRGSGSSATSSLSCRTVNGRTACVGSGGLRCETVNGRLACRGGGSSSHPQILGPNFPLALPPMIDEGEGED